MANHRDEILDKIRNLRAKASNAASTEAEAQTAAMMAAKLLQKHDVKETELEIQEEGAAHKKTAAARVMPEILNYCALGIERLTETKTYAEAGTQLCYIGTPHDVEMALYLTEMLVGASKRAWSEAAGDDTADFKEMTKRRLSFYQGFGCRVHNRLMALANERAEARMQARGTATGSALVVVKSALIKAKMEEMGLELIPGKKRNIGLVDPKAYAKGASAGDQVNLNRPLNGDEWEAVE